MKNNSRVSRVVSLSGIMTCFLIGLLGLLFFPPCSSSQVIDETPHEKLTVDSRLSSMGGPYASDITNASSMVVNPAVLSILREKNIQVDVIQDWTERTVREVINFPLSLSNDVHLGFQGSFRHPGVIEEKSKFEGLQFNQYYFSASSSLLISPSFSLGIGGGFSAGSGTSGRKKAFNGSTGFVYRPSPGISYALSYDVGNQLIYSQDVVSMRSSFKTTDYGHTIRFGMSMWYPERKETQLALSIGAEKTIDIEGVTYRGGIEYYPAGIVAIRIGYINSRAFSSTRFGLGLRFNRFGIDYAISPVKKDHLFQQLGLSLVLDK